MHKPKKKCFCELRFFQCSSAAGAGLCTKFCNYSSVLQCSAPWLTVHQNFLSTVAMGITMVPWNPFRNKTVILWNLYWNQLYLYLFCFYIRKWFFFLKAWETVTLSISFIAFCQITGLKPYCLPPNFMPHCVFGEKMVHLSAIDRPVSRYQQLLWIVTV